MLGLGFFVWLAKFQIDRQYAYYDVLFDNVSGLSRAADVTLQRPLGRAGGLARHRREGLRAGAGAGRGGGRHADPQGATAQLQAQGVTGVSLVSVNPGDPTKPLLREAVEGVPVIQGQRSVVQSLTEDAPDLLAEVDQAGEGVPGLVGEENQDKVAAILANVEQASGAFETALADFSSISKSVAGATGQNLGLHRQARSDRRWRWRRRWPRRGRRWRR